jgi:outer membrane protein assembly factor BamA
MRLQALAAGYLPLPFSSSLLLSARGGYVYHFDSDSKTPGDRRFYLGGASTLRGFPEDGLQPEDSRTSLHQQIDHCHQITTGLACTPGVQLALQGISSGGDLFMALRAEARVAVGGSWEVAGFYDAGNLLAQPTALLTPVSDLLKLHDAVGGGLRYATPIGRMALDVGVNLRPDDELGERRVGLYFSIDTL